MANDLVHELRIFLETSILLKLSACSVVPTFGSVANPTGFGAYISVRKHMDFAIAIKQY